MATKVRPRDALGCATWCITSALARRYVLPGLRTRAGSAASVAGPLSTGQWPPRARHRGRPDRSQRGADRLGRGIDIMRCREPLIFQEEFEHNDGSGVVDADSATSAEASDTVTQRD
jgi:hypothetical protein